MYFCPILFSILAKLVYIRLSFDNQRTWEKDSYGKTSQENRQNQRFMSGLNIDYYSRVITNTIICEGFILNHHNDCLLDTLRDAPEIQLTHDAQ